MTVPTHDSSMPTSSAALPWRDGTGRLRVTAIVKVTYQLRPGGLAVVAAPLPLFEDVPRDPARPGSLATASDLVPFKLHADVLVGGHVHPSRPGTARQLVEVAVARGADVALVKRLVAVGARPSPDAPPAALGPIAPSWPQRVAYLLAGSAVDSVLSERPISLPRDFDVRFFQSAP